MLKMENISWSDLDSEEKKVFKICGKIIAWIHKETEPERLHFYEALRLVDEVNYLFERFSRRPYYHRRDKLIEDFWDAAILDSRFQEVKRIYNEKRGSLKTELPEAGFNLITESTMKIIAQLGDINIVREGQNVKLTKVWREDEDWVEVRIKPIAEAGYFLITVDELFCFRGGTASHPHLLDFNEFLRKNLEKTGNGIDFSLLRIERYDHTHDDPDGALIEKFVSVSPVRSGKELQTIFDIVLQRIVDTPRIFTPQG